ncbi:MAG: glycosyltransferase [Tatlockia sp.]|jgi:glycosyltransferase involved in cell wall biosynthesis
MRIVIDLQGAQSDNNEICRFSMSLAKALIRNRRNHEIIIALNGLFHESIERIRAQLAPLLPQENIRLWHAPDPKNQASRRHAEILREAFLTHLKPDMLINTNLFTEDGISSIGLLNQVIPTAVILYDLLPLLDKARYLPTTELEAWYVNKFSHLGRANLVFTLSEQMAQVAAEHLCLPAKNLVNISAAACEAFKPLPISPALEDEVRASYKLSKPFVMYCGGVNNQANREYLIQSYAKLPKKLRASHQLLLVCPAEQEESRKSIEALALKQGLSRKEFVLAGSVPDKILSLLYNLCTVFVFPGVAESFHLPLLEAMHCGKPVLAANTPSLRAIIESDKALFEGTSPEALRNKLVKVLSDADYAEKAGLFALERAKAFSIDTCAERAIRAMEDWHGTHRTTTLSGSIKRPKLAYVSPLPPARSGISYYSAELLPALNRFYDLEVIVSQEEEVTDTWIKANCAIRNLAWFSSHGNRYYDRVLYHFGNSPFHIHMYELLEDIPGVVVLHDFFLSDLIGTHRDVYAGETNQWALELYCAHGYKAVQERFTAETSTQVIAKYPCNLSMLQQAEGVIVHSEHSKQLAKQYYGERNANDWAVIPLLQRTLPPVDREAARKALKLDKGAFVVCSFGMLNATKLNHRLIEAWLSSSLRQNKQCVLVFVGELTAIDYEQKLQQLIAKAPIKGQIRITGWVDTNTFRHYLAASDLAVQFRAKSRGETSAAVLDCMNYGIPTLVNANGSMADLPDHAVYKLPDEFTDKALISALEKLKDDSAFRQKLSRLACEFIKDHHAPQACAEQYFAAIEACYKRKSASFPSLAKTFATLHTEILEPQQRIELAQALEKSIAPSLYQPQLFLDISALVETDLKTGIQRVVRSILTEWINNPPAGYRLEPIYCLNKDQYRYARQFTLNFLGCPSDFLEDEPIEYRAGDVYLGIDLAHYIVVEQANFYQALRRQGVKVMFLIYDLLPLQFPQSFYQAMDEWHQRWLEVVAQNDAAICISKTVADDFKTWWNTHRPNRLRPFQLSWFHLGADIKNSVPTLGMPEEANALLARLKESQAFLMVGTIEPRKGYRQVLAAFEQLWQKDNSLLLVIIGKKGWMMDTFIEQVGNHPEFNKRLIWLEGISDEYMEKIYASSTCLIAASEGEGFGLPLIEAAQHMLPILARDIPVFREVAGQHAAYFDATSAEGLAEAINEWLSLYEKGEVAQSHAMPWLTWEQSAQQLSMALAPQQVEYQEMIN